MKKINQEWQALRDQGYSTIKIGQMVGKHASHIGRHTVKPSDFLEKRRKLYDEGKVELDFSKGPKNLAEFNKRRIKKEKPKPIKKAKQKPLDKWKATETLNKGKVKITHKDVILPTRNPVKERKVVVDSRTWLYVKESDKRTDEQIIKDYFKRIA